MDIYNQSSVLSLLKTSFHLPYFIASIAVFWGALDNSQDELRTHTYLCLLCLLYIGLHYSLTVFFDEYVRVTKIGTTEKTLFQNEFITMTLPNVAGSLGGNQQFELILRCPKCDVNILIPVADFERHVEVIINFHHDTHMIICRGVQTIRFQKEETGCCMNIGDIGDVDSTEQESFTYSQKAKLHQKVLNRCLPDIVKDLDFKTVSIYIQQKELFDDVTMRNILEQRTTTKQIKELIQRICQRDEKTYEKFKECLVQAKQEFLKNLLEKEEAICTESGAAVSIITMTTSTSTADFPSKPDPLTMSLSQGTEITRL